MSEQSETHQYCPICQRWIEADNIEEVRSGEDDGFLFIHDPVAHSDSDIEAVMNGIQ